MADRDNIIEEEELNKKIRDLLKSIKREDWIIPDYELAIETLYSDLQAMREALYILYWESARTRDDVQKALDTIRGILRKEVLMNV